MKRFLAVFTAVLLTSLVATNAAHAIVTFNQGFEVDTSDTFGFNSTVSRVASGTGGIASKTGSFHGTIGDPLTAPGTGAFTRFDGYRDTWTGTYFASIDVYLDTTWALGSGFDYSVASNGSDGLHQRDFIFHVARDTSTGSLLVGGSNNSNFATRQDLDTLSNFFIVPSSGWYTFQHRFYNNGGQLAVDLNLIDGSNTTVFTETRTTALDQIPADVGGNRYGWFTFVNLEGDLNVDNWTLELTNDELPTGAVPEPATMALFGTGLLGAALRRKFIG